MMASPIFYRTFAAVKANRKRKIVSWMLLAVFVPMLLLSSLHIHSYDQTGDDQCTECVHHHCGGHLTQLSTTMHQCVLCQFLSLTLVIAGAVCLVNINKEASVRIDAQQRNVCVAHSGIVGLRAPPAFSIL